MHDNVWKLLLARSKNYALIPSYDIPAALNTSLQKWLGSDYADYQYQLNVLYSVYSFPNMILPLLAGYFVDKLGPNRMIFAFSSFICLGSIIFAVGTSFKSFPVMVLGRLVFGFGGESLEVAIARITTDWFQGNNKLILYLYQGNGLAMALGFNLSFARVATALNDNMSPYLDSIDSVTLAAWVGVLVCFISFFSAMMVLYLDQPESRMLAGIHSHYHKINVTVDPPISETEPLLNETIAFQSEVIEGSTVCIEDTNVFIDEKYEEDETIHIDQVYGLSTSFWLLCLITIALYGNKIT